MSDKTEKKRLSLLAIDYGERRIGLATGSIAAGISSALRTLLARDGTPDWTELDSVVNEWRPDILVIGLPYNMDGSESDMTTRVRKFVKLLAERYGLPVETVDERLTSAEAEARLKEQRRQGIRTRKLKKEDVDSMAAQLIAESWMTKSGSRF